MFYSNLVKKIKEDKLEVLKESYTFRMSIVRIMPHVVILCIALILVPFLFVIYKQEGLGPFIYLVIFLAGVAVVQIINSFKFKFEIKEGNLLHKKHVINLDEVKVCTLKNGVLPRGKKLEPFLSIVDINKVEKIIPLHMGNKVLFIQVIKELLGSKFIIIEEK